MMGSNDKPQDPVAGSITPTRPTLVDTEASIIVDVEATPAHRTQEVWSTQTRIERVKEHFPGAAKKLIGDTAYSMVPI